MLIFAAETFLGQIDRPYSINNSTWKTAAIVIWAAKLLTSENAKLDEHEQHEEKRIK